MLTRGIGGVLADHWLTILSGPLRILSTDKLDDPDAYTLPPYISQQFRALRERTIPSLCSSDPAALRTCLDALEGLELVYKNCHFLHPHLPRSKLEIGVALGWMSLVPAEYMTLLNQRNTMALILLAHFVVLFAGFGDEWFLQGWCEQAMKSIESIVSEQCRADLEWPLEQLREKHARSPV